MVLQTGLLTAVLLLLWPGALSSGPVSLGDIVCNLTAAADGPGSGELQLVTAAVPACPAGWSSHGRSCYLVSPTASSWLGAAAACAAIDERARLASVRQANHGHLEALTAASGAHYLWVGGVRLRPGGADWAWVDGAGVDYVNWAQGQSTVAKQDCMALQGPKSDYQANIGEWHDAECSLPAHNFGFICQINLS
ncbi:Perlucin-like protein [Amphibalanus amphitrite]|uniref:Perlucin-like protein n=1 Tax=Amphibalanus amphitrite TaxID=1232801 RepID=A0A6A4VAB7_AMPAM|nr:Perlucin-like protein [Amphibalanus amphitrite]